MAIIYVRSTDGLDTDDGSTWALAKATLAGATAIDAAGDSIYLSQSHAESTAASQTIALAGTPANPVRVICGNDGAAPPTTPDSTATVTTTGNSAITITGSGYLRGIAFSSGSGLNNINLNLGYASTDVQEFELCKFIMGVPATGYLYIGNNSTANGKITWKNCQLKFNAAGQYASVRHKFVWDGGSIVSGSVTPTGALFQRNGMNNGAGADALISGIDFTNFSSSLLLAKMDSDGLFLFRQCLLPTGWTTANLLAGTIASGARVEMHNCMAGSTPIPFASRDLAGAIDSETTIVATGGATDGTTPSSLKLVSSASSNYPSLPLVTPEIAKWNSIVGSAITVTIEIAHDSITALNNDEIWPELQYMGTSGNPISSFVSGAKANPLAAPAAHAASSATWNTTGLTNPNKQKLSVTFTPQRAGFIIAKVFFAKPSKTVYIDHKLTVA